MTIGILQIPFLTANKGYRTKKKDVIKIFQDEVCYKRFNRYDEEKFDQKLDYDDIEAGMEIMQVPTVFLGLSSEVGREKIARI